jgi:LPS-assembly protein
VRTFFAIRLFVLVCFFSGILLFPVNGNAADQSGPSKKQPSQDKVVVLADHLRFNRKTHLIHAVGHAYVSRGNISLNADEVIINRETNIVWAAGHVHLRAPKTKMKAKRLRLNLSNGKAHLINGSVDTIQPYTGNGLRAEYTYHITGKVIDKLSSDHYHVVNGNVTTCDCLPDTTPSWMMQTGSADLYLGDHFDSTNDVLHIKGLPAIYLPYFSFPVVSRKTGLLMPFGNYNSIQGLVFQDSLFWDLDPSYDLMLTVDDMSNFGLGEGLTYRQSFSQNQNLLLSYSQQAVNDPSLGLRTNITQTMDLYNYSGQDFNLMGNINFVSAQDFYQLMSVGSTASFNPQMMSSIYANYYQDNSEVNLIGVYNEDIFPGPNTTVSKLPQGDLAIMDYRLGETPFYFSSFLSGVDFMAGPILMQRGLLFPHLSGSFSLGDGAVEISPHGGVLQSFYSEGNGSPSPYSQTVPNGGIAIRSAIEKDFVLPSYLGGGTITHQIVFNGDYEYSPQNNESAIIQNGWTDNIPGLNAAYYGITNRFFYDGQSGTSEILSFKIAQEAIIDSYSTNTSPTFYGGTTLSNPFSNLPGPLSPILLEGHLLPSDPVSFYGEAFYDATSKVFPTEDLSMIFNQAAVMPEAINFLFQIGETSYRAGTVPMVGNYFTPLAITEGYSQPTNATFLVPSIGVSTKLGLYGSVAYYDDLDPGPSGGIQMEVLSAGYQGSCWSFGLMYSLVIEPAPLPVQTTYGFSLTLNGIAGIGQLISPVMPPPVP